MIASWPDFQRSGTQPPPPRLRTIISSHHGAATARSARAALQRDLACQPPARTAGRPAFSRIITRHLTECDVASIPARENRPLSLQKII